jgi:DNA-binding response OmpR family regulator
MNNVVSSARSGNASNTHIKTLDSRAPVRGQGPTILIVDDNRDLLLFLAIELEEEGWRMLTAENAKRARILFAAEKPDTVLLDYMLGDEDGLRLGMQFQEQASRTQIIIMTGGGLAVDELNICEEREFPVLNKPFLVDAVLNLVRSRYRPTSAAASS